MKISMWSSFYVDLSPEDTVLELEKYGYGYSELSTEHADVLLDRGDASKAGAELKAFADAHGVSFSQGHLMLRGHICSPADREYIKRQLDLFFALGTSRAVLHVDRIPGETDVELLREKNLEALADLTQYVSGSNMVICLENLTANSFVRTAEDILWFLDRLNSPNLGICLDTGHLNLCEDRDQARFIKTAGKHLKALHLADNDGTGDQHLMPCARGQVDFASVVREAEALGYDGLYNFEIGGERQEPLEIRGFKLDYIRRIMEYHFENRFKA